jgi:two-component system, OmpR family, response regulator MprA
VIGSTNSRELTAIAPRGLGGIGRPGEMLRRLTLDGVVVVAATVPSEITAKVQLLCVDRGWPVVDARTPDQASWASGARKTSLVVVTGTDPGFVLETVAAVRRSSTSSLAVCAELSAAQRKAALSAGADLVLSPSLDTDELGEHLEALLRHASDTWEPQVRYLTSAGLVVDLWARECHLDEQALCLSRTEYELLLFLMRYPRQVIPIEKIIQRVWGSRAYRHQINAARIAISRLRTKLTPAAASQPFIVSARGIGYKFDGPVLEIGDRASGAHDYELASLRLSTLVLDIAAALQERSFASAAQYCIDTIVSATGGSAGAIFYRASGRIYLLAEQGNPAQFRQLMRTGVSVRGRAEVHSVDLRQATQVGDVSHLARISETVKVMSLHGFRSYLYVPLITGGWKWGGLRLASRATRPFDPLVTTFCSAVGAMLSMKLQNPKAALAELARAEPIKLAVGAP